MIGADLVATALAHAGVKVIFTGIVTLMNRGRRDSLLLDFQAAVLAHSHTSNASERYSLNEVRVSR